jgi:UDP-N-acetylglucosamine--N-acetylmuramyl-(pentapeptide) pyrophosphoryl-undecaprenol N-acetylglucosamine transferase
MNQSQVVLVAAGTGGHINAAKSIGSFFKDHGFDIVYFTGRRPLDIRLFKDENTIFLNGQSLRNRSTIKKVISLFGNLIVFVQSFSAFSKNRPKLVIGAGGYICGPVLLAAFFLGVPIYILEQNSVMGLTNKLLAFFANKIFINFRKTKGMSKYLAKLSIVGNPINNAIRTHCFGFHSDQTIKVLVVGGSLGALEINNFFEKFISNKYDWEIAIRHQTGIDKGFEVKDSKVQYQQLDYIDDMVQEYEWADLIVCRAGASTLSELRYVQKPVILIPYRFATDNHQKINAELFKDESSFSVYVHSIEELADNNSSLFLNILTNNLNDIKRIRVDLSNRESTEELIYRECRNDF